MGHSRLLRLHVQTFGMGIAIPPASHWVVLGSGLGSSELLPEGMQDGCITAAAVMVWQHVPPVGGLCPWVAGHRPPFSASGGWGTIMVPARPSVLSRVQSCYMALPYPEFHVHYPECLVT